MKIKQNIPFYGIDRFFAQHKEEINRLFNTIGESGHVIGGKDVSLFEEALAKFGRRRFAVSVSSCTDALFFALLAAGVKPGDEVLVPSFSFIASATPILQVGAIPVFTDILPDTLSMDPKDVERKITPKTKAIIFVHLYGTACPVQDIAALALKHGLMLIEDNAHSLGSKDSQEMYAGTTSQISCVSFDPTKIIGGFGTAGALLTDDEALHDTLLRLRYHGKNESTNEHEQIGYNSRISSFQGAYLNFQLGMIHKLIERRREIALYYNSMFTNNTEITPLQNSNSVYHKYVVISKERNKLKYYLKERGIQCMIHYEKPLYEHKVFKNNRYRAEHISHTPKMTNTVLSLPIFPEMTDNELQYIGDVLQSYFH